MKKILALALALTFTTSASATVISGDSFTGNLDNDEARYYIQFDVTADNSLVDFTSWGYAGGVNFDGDTIADGGFDSQLFIFDSNSTELESDDDASNVNSVSSNRSWDAKISRLFDIGSYTAVLTQYDSDYVSGDLVTGNWSTSGRTNYVDATGSQRSSAYAFDIVGANLANVTGIGHDTTGNDIPEPTSLAIFGLALAGLASRRKKA